MEDSNIVDRHYGSGYSKMEAEVYEGSPVQLTKIIDKEKSANEFAEEIETLKIINTIEKDERESKIVD